MALLQIARDNNDRRNDEQTIAELKPPISVRPPQCAGNEVTG